MYNARVKKNQRQKKHGNGSRNLEAKKNENGRKEKKKKNATQGK